MSFVCLFQMPEDLLLPLVHYPFYLSDGHIKFFSQWLIAYAVNEPALQDRSVLLVQDPFVYGFGYLCPGIVSHFLLAIAAVAMPLPELLTETFLLLAVPFDADLFLLVAVFLFICAFDAIVYLPIIPCVQYVRYPFVIALDCI